MIARILAVLLLVVTAAAIGAGLGLGLNLLNAQVSPEYFQIVLGAGGGPMPVRHVALFHGIIEGGIAGAVFGLVFAAFAVATGWRRLRAENLLRPLLAGYAAAIVCIMTFGLTGMALARLDPTAYEGLFPLAGSAANLPAFGWVGGSIWGGYAGGLAAAVTAAVVWRRDLRRQADHERGFEVC